MYLVTMARASLARLRGSQLPLPLTAGFGAHFIGELVWGNQVLTFERQLSRDFYLVTNEAVCFWPEDCDEGTRLMR